MGRKQLGRKLGAELMPGHLVLTLIEPFAGKGQNVTIDKFFTSPDLSEQLKTKNASIVGTVNRIRR